MHQGILESALGSLCTVFYFLGEKKEGMKHSKTQYIFTISVKTPVLEILHF